ncbi:DNA-processing protein DprA [Rhodococcus aetherivorans]
MEDDYLRQAAIVMASLELLPAQPSDLTHILRNPDQFQTLLDPSRLDPSTGSSDSELVRYLCDSLDHTRIEYWHKQIDILASDEVARPILSADIPGGPVYPGRLAECWDAPPILFATAAMDRETSSVAIIGSRAARTDVVSDAHDLAADLAASGTTIVSGLALGVDAAAHEGALAADGITVAVMGTGITRIYPEQNTELAHRIRRNGVLVSQFPPYAPRTRTSFLRRNHVIAGLSDVSIIMSGESRSGSRHEIQQAIGYGRPVLMWSPALEHQEWARKLADSGEAIFVASTEEVRRTLDGLDQ